MHPSKKQNISLNYCIQILQKNSLYSYKLGRYYEEQKNKIIQCLQELKSQLQDSKSIKNQLNNLNICFKSMFQGKQIEKQILKSNKMQGLTKFYQQNRQKIWKYFDKYQAKEGQQANFWSITAQCVDDALQLQKASKNQLTNQIYNMSSQQIKGIQQLENNFLCGIKQDDTNYRLKISNPIKQKFNLPKDLLSRVEHQYVDWYALYCNLWYICQNKSDRFENIRKEIDLANKCRQLTDYIKQIIYQYSKKLLKLLNCKQKQNFNIHQMIRLFQQHQDKIQQNYKNKLLQSPKVIKSIQADDQPKIANITHVPTNTSKVQPKQSLNNKIEQLQKTIKEQTKAIEGYQLATKQLNKKNMQLQSQHKGQLQKVKQAYTSKIAQMQQQIQQQTAQITQQNKQLEQLKQYRTQQNTTNQRLRQFQQFVHQINEDILGIKNEKLALAKVYNQIRKRISNQAHIQNSKAKWGSSNQKGKQMGQDQNNQIQFEYKLFVEQIFQQINKWNVSIQQQFDQILSESQQLTFKRKKEFIISRTKFKPELLDQSPQATSSASINNQLVIINQMNKIKSQLQKSKQQIKTKDHQYKLLSARAQLLQKQNQQKIQKIKENGHNKLMETASLLQKEKKQLEQQLYAIQKQKAVHQTNLKSQKQINSQISKQLQQLKKNPATIPTSPVFHSLPLPSVSLFPQLSSISSLTLLQQTFSPSQCSSLCHLPLLSLSKSRQIQIYPNILYHVYFVDGTDMLAYSSTSIDGQYGMEKDVVGVIYDGKKYLGEGKVAKGSEGEVQFQVGGIRVKIAQDGKFVYLQSKSQELLGKQVSSGNLVSGQVMKIETLGYSIYKIKLNQKPTAKNIPLVKVEEQKEKLEKKNSEYCIQSSRWDRTRDQIEKSVDTKNMSVFQLNQQLKQFKSKVLILKDQNEQLKTQLEKQRKSQTTRPVSQTPGKYNQVTNKQIGQTNIRPIKPKIQEEDVDNLKNSLKEQIQLLKKRVTTESTQNKMLSTQLDRQKANKQQITNKLKEKQKQLSEKTEQLQKCTQQITKMKLINQKRSQQNKQLEISQNQTVAIKIGLTQNSQNSKNNQTNGNQIKNKISNTNEKTNGPKIQGEQEQKQIVQKKDVESQTNQEKNIVQQSNQIMEDGNIKNMQQQIQNKNKQIQQLKKQFESAKEQLAQYSHQISQKKQESYKNEDIQFSQKRKKSQQQIDDFQKQLSIKDAKIKELSFKIEQQKKIGVVVYDNLPPNIRPKAQKTEAIDKQAVSKAKQQLENIRQVIRKANEKLSAIQKDNSNKTASLIKLSQKERNLLTRIKQIQQKTAQQSKQQQKAKQILSNIEMYKTQKIEIEQKLFSCKSQLKSIESEILQKNKQLDAHNSALLARKAQLQLLNSQISKLKSLSQSFTASNQKLQKQVQVQTQSVNSKKAQSVSLSQSLLEQKKSLSKITLQLKSKQLQLSQVVQTHSTRLSSTFRKVDSLFIGDVFPNPAIPERYYLISEIEKCVDYKRIVKTRLLFRFPQMKVMAFHPCIDEKGSYVVVVRLADKDKNGENYVVAMFSEESLGLKEKKDGRGFVAGLNNRAVFGLRKAFDYKPYLIQYNEFYIVFGNSELKIRNGCPELQFLIGHNFRYLDTGNLKEPSIFSGTNDEKATIISYEIYQIIFDKQKEK